MQQLSIRRGDTLYVECQLVDQFGAGQSLAGMQVQAKLIDKGGFIAFEFQTTVKDEGSGKFSLDQSSTSAIPAALYTLQIIYQKEATSVSASSFELLIRKHQHDAPVRFAQVASVIGNTRVLITVPVSLNEETVWDDPWDEVWVND